MLTRLARPRVVLVAGLLFLLDQVIWTVVFGPWFRDRAGGAQYLEAVLRYTPDELYTALTAYGAEGRRLYVLSSVTFDILTPLIYAVFFTGAALWVASRLGLRGRWPALIGVAGLVLFASDLAENLTLDAVVAAYPDRADALAGLAQGLTLLKAGLMVALVGFAVVGGVVLLVSRWRGRSAGEAAA